MQDELIRYENAGIHFGSKKVLSNFSICIPKGKKILMKGKSGTGKSTLFKILLEFEKLSEGSVYYRGVPLTPRIAWQIRKDVAYVLRIRISGKGL